MQVYNVNITEDQIHAAREVMKLRHNTLPGFTMHHVERALVTAGVEEVNESWQNVSWRAAERLVQDAQEAGEIEWDVSERCWVIKNEKQ